MTETGVSASDVELVVLDLAVQEVLVLLQGAAVLELEGNGAKGGEARPIPDPVATFVEVARRGMLGRPPEPPWLSGAELLDRQVDLAPERQIWRVRMTNLDPGAFLVLANLLRARTPERAAITTILSSHEGVTPSGLALGELRYPRPFLPTSLPFPVDYKMPDRSSRERFLQVSFARNPQPSELDVICEGLDAWAQLPLLGGYPAADMKPWQSAAVGEPAFLLDPCTVEQAFPDIFLCDDDCYAAVINWAHVLNRAVCPVAGVLLR